jgi:type I restriction-modification system DNA methylase subunit
LQAKGYVWNTRQVFFVILTDFAEFRFYDASRQPDERNPDDGLLLDLKYGDYLSSLEKLWEFSKERVAAGSLDALLPKARRAPHLRRQVDDVFLDEMTGWREELAKDIHKRNPALTAKQLNEVVQRLLDRIVFIRIAEDRHVIEKRQLAEVVEEWETHGGKFPIFDWLNDLFHKINEDFNGEIFKPHLSEEIQIDSEILARIIKRLYPPQSPYRFDVIGVELLGSIYERYLGNTIRLTPKQVRVEEKPEVRKAGGVYYTPKYIVDYIVKNTVGKMIEGKTPKQIERIRILDPACGSGSFLIGAFQYLIDYHTQWYLEHPEQEVRHAHPSLDFMREVHTDPDGSKRLSVYRKAKILRNNLFGVDIDPQAVEITMMSLYLKALEGEQSQLPPKQHLLPELKYNIMCGNSLIGPDIYDQGVLFADEERDRINAFDWNFIPVGPSGARPWGGTRKEPPDRTPPPEGRAPLGPTSIGQVMKDGGFDCVIGNPPWGYDFSEIELRYLRTEHRPIIVRMIDSFMFFVAKACGLARQGGRVGMIVPDVVLYQVDNLRLRELLLESFRLNLSVNLGDRVFARVTRPSCIFVAQRGEPGNNRVGVLDVSGMTEDEKVEALKGRKGPNMSRIRQADISLLPGKLVPVKGTRNYAVWFRLKRDMGFADLAEFVDEDGIQRGVSPDLKEAFVVDVRQAQEERLEAPWLRNVLLGGDIKRYRIEYADRLLLYLTGSDDPKMFPRIREFVAQFRNQITCTEVRDHKHSIFALHRARDERIFLKKTKLVGVITEDEPILARDDEQLFATDGAYLFAVKDDVNCNYILGIVNSGLMRFLYRLAATETNRVLAQVKPTILGTLPVRAIDAHNPVDKARHDKIVALVDRMLELNKQKHSGRLAPSQVERVDREIAATDAEIDDLVYDLYGITDEERKIIEGG